MPHMRTLGNANVLLSLFTSVRTAFVAASFIACCWKQVLLGVVWVEGMREMLKADAGRPPLFLVEFWRAGEI